jgi:hypothetical protein
VYRPLNFQPIGQGRPVVTLATTMAIMDSNNGFYDSFVFSFFNRSEQLLAAIIFDNSILGIYYDDRSGSEFNTGWKFRNNIYDWLVVTVDFAANTWSATLGNSPIFTNRRFHGGGAIRDLGDVSVDWYIGNLFAAGNNYVLFDNYSVAASAALTPPVITGQPQSRTNSAGSLANFSVTANSAGPLRYQWQFKDAPIPGATNALLTLLNVNASQSGAYRVLVSNPAGSTLSQAAVLTVTEQTALLQLSAPRSTARGFEFRISASPGRTYAVQTSTNLLFWEPAASVTMDASGATLFLDHAATNRPQGFYRVKAAE